MTNETVTLQLPRAAFEALRALLDDAAERAPEDLMAVLEQALPGSGGHDFDDRCEAWGRLCSAVRQATPPVPGA